MAFTIAQISDTHLGKRTRLFHDNFGRVAAALAAAPPDLVVASGDMSLDGAGSADDLALAARMFARLPAPVHMIPGNHDVGDLPAFAPRQPVDDGRLRLYRGALGRDRWVLDRDGWRLLGLDSQIMGAHPEADEQAAMVADALDTLGTRRLAVFIHKPLFIADPDETRRDYWAVTPEARGPLLPLIRHPQLRLVASGHLHLHHEETRGAVHYAWAPAVSFLVGTGLQPGLPGARRTGILLHRFDEDSVETRLVQPPGLEAPYIEDVQDEAYPRA